MRKRHVDVAVISDVHLGTFGCRADELNSYLKSINPSILVLNGDIIDAWQFKKSYFPETHLKVMRRIMKMMMQGTKVYYLTGNHDDVLRRFSDMNMGEFYLLDKLVLELDGKKVWIFHGDIFDVTMRYSRFVAKMGGFGYDLLILINWMVNSISVRLGKGKISLSKRIKDSVKSAVKFISDFEVTAIDLAFDNGYDLVICGHIHRPNITEHARNGRTVTYLNSGDWIENLTSLEYRNGEWSLFSYKDEDFLNIDDLFPENEDASMSLFEDTILKYQFAAS